MEILYTKYAAQDYKLYQLENDAYNEEILIPQKSKQRHPQNQSVNLEASDEEKIYIKLAHCEDTDSILEFCKEYGTLINPYNYNSIEPRHDFCVLKSILNDTLKENKHEKANLAQADYLISLKHFKIYQCEIKMLLDMHKFINNNSFDDAIEFINRCKNFFWKDSFYDLICLEYKNVIDDDIEDIFISTPFSLVRFLIGKNDSYSKDPDMGKSVLSNILVEKNVDKTIADCFLKTLYFKADNINLNLEKITQTIKQICADLFLFHLHDLYLNPLLPSKDMTFSIPSETNVFPSLISAIFYYFCSDIMGPIDIRKCANPNCGKQFICKKSSRKKYCSQRCEHIITSKRYKEKSKH